jgi:deoxyribonuclease-4
MPLLGAHVSVAGGLPLAVDRAVAHGFQAFQIFTRNPNQWCSRRLPRSEILEFRAKVAVSRIEVVVSHASYLINLAARSATLRKASMNAMADEIDRAEALGLLGVVLHPGAYTNGTEEDGVELIAAGLDDLLAKRPRGRTNVLLEQTAGQGTSLGATFEQLAAIITKMKRRHRVGVCLDTCHLLAAGYDLGTSEGYEDTFERFGRSIGFERLKVIHLNDSKRPLGSRVDRHDHIGHGCLGLPPFRRILNDARFKNMPMLLETPKTGLKSARRVEIDLLDERNLATLRGLIQTVAH